MNTTSEKFTLYIYDGDYGLPSLDVECLKSFLYTSVAKVPVQVKPLNNLKDLLFHSAPSFKHKNVSFYSFSDMVLYLNTLNYNLDMHLSPKQKSESLALTNFVNSKLRTVVEYVFWLDQRNFEEFTRVWYSRALPMPFNIMYVKAFKEKSIDLIESTFPIDCSLEVIKDLLHPSTNECLSSLSARLGTLNYFYGDTPTTLDIVVYSYIAPLHKLPFPSNSLSSMVSLWPNLIRFMKRIESKYLPELPKVSKYIKQEDKVKTADDEISYVAISILTLSAMTLMFGFAISKGFISSKLF